jgi:hypothetical protein
VHVSRCVQFSCVSVTVATNVWKVNLSLCLTNKALHHEDLWGNGCIDPIDPRILTSAVVGDEWPASSPGEGAPITC